MKVAGLIGDPVEHSLSPFMHNAAFAHVGMDAVYELWPTPLSELPVRITSLRDGSYLGANVTVPHKQAVIPLLDSVSETAGRIGAVNTIIPFDGGLRGDNTDAYGFGLSLQQAVDGNVPRSAVVVGAGGAARAVLVSLQESGCERIILINRSPERALELATALGHPGFSPVVPQNWDDLPDVAADVGVLVNATSVGWHGSELPFDSLIVDRLPGDSVILDLTYRRTALLDLASARGLKAVDGLAMLIHQGARAFELWTGRAASVAVMTDAVLAEQARRA